MDSGGNSQRMASGASQPRSDGPSAMPATTSAMTRGCPSQRRPGQSAADTAMMTMSWTRSWASMWGFIGQASLGKC